MTSTGGLGLAPICLLLLLCAANPAVADPHHRLGIDGVAAAGANVMVGGGVRYELGPARSGFDALARIDVLTGGAPGGGAKDLIQATIGARGYLGRAVFAEASAGIGALHLHAYDDGVDRATTDHWEALVALRLATGVKLGPIDVGVNFMIPTWGVGIQLGVDVASW